MPLASAPSLNADDEVALGNDFEFQTLSNTPFETTVDILLPDLDVEVRFLFGEVEWVDATIEVRVLRECQSVGQQD